MKKIILTVFALASLAGQLLAGDLKITYKKEVKAMAMTQRSEEVHYYSSQFQRVNNAQEKKDSLTDFRDFTMYAIDHKKKTISKITLDEAIKIVELSMDSMKNMDPNAKKIMESMFGGGGSVNTVQAGTETVAGRTCKKWRITLGSSTFEIWADPSLPSPIPDATMEKAYKLKDSLSAATPGMADMIAKLSQEMAKIKGVQLKSDTQFSTMGITSRTVLEATKIENGAIPASVFELPKYKIEETGKKMVADLTKASGKSSKK